MEPLGLVVVAVAGAVVVAAVLLIPPILWPKVIAYPWKLPDSPSTRASEKRQTVVMGGSFNPPHRGHLAMIEYLSKRYGHVIVVIGINPNKKYPVSPVERVELMRKMIDAKNLTKNVRVEVFAGYIWRYAKRQKATTFFRGIRSWERDGTEERALQILNTWGPLLLGPLFWPLPTIYLEGKPEYNHISSTLVRDISKNMSNNSGSVEQALKEFIPDEVVKDVAKLYSETVPENDKKKA